MVGGLGPLRTRLKAIQFHILLRCHLVSPSFRLRMITMKTILGLPANRGWQRLIDLRMNWK